MNSPNTMNHTLESAEAFRKRLKKWSSINWHLSNWLTTISVLCSAIVPFGLSALLYIPDDKKSNLNIILIVISGVAFALQFIVKQLSLEKRAISVREAFVLLEKSIPLYNDGVISQDELREAYEKSLSIWQRQEFA